LLLAPPTAAAIPVHGAVIPHLDEIRRHLPEQVARLCLDPALAGNR